MSETSSFFGEREYGKFEYGNDIIFKDPTGRLLSLCAWGKFGKPGKALAGIYQRQPTSKGQIVRRLKFYKPTNPQTEDQQAHRQKLADGVTAWQTLTTNEKAVYNKRAEGRHMSGYNLFLSEYIQNN